MTRRKGKPKRRRAVVVTLGTVVRRGRGKRRTTGVIVGWDLRTGQPGRWIIDELRESRR